eukprot:NODE_2869_length_1024_cov_17.848205_g2404_i0.p1 GENE.NODE_2869_length_1024_cov_17.848205_g2404_i0~~NODE_2869_length_1024_cov_17.848205_g2404_i0.p1  ORF type:complete len:271 (-),score=37.51 NODE_2869_length_1024_cov_17.848205_g2404_i0:78-890(-)
MLSQHWGLWGFGGGGYFSSTKDLYPGDHNRFPHWRGYGELYQTQWTPKAGPDVVTGKTGHTRQVAQGKTPHIHPTKGAMLPFHRELRALSPAEIVDLLQGKGWIINKMHPGPRRLWGLAALLTSVAWFTRAAANGSPVWKFWWRIPIWFGLWYGICQLDWRIRRHRSWQHYEQELEGANRMRARFVARFDEDIKKYNEPPSRNEKNEHNRRRNDADTRPYSVWPGDIPMPYNYSVYDAEKHTIAPSIFGAQVQTHGGLFGDPCNLYYDGN